MLLKPTGNYAANTNKIIKNINNRFNQNMMDEDASINDSEFESDYDADYE